MKRLLLILLFLPVLAFAQAPAKVDTFAVTYQFFKVNTGWLTQPGFRTVMHNGTDSLVRYWDSSWYFCTDHAAHIYSQKPYHKGKK